MREQMSWEERARDLESRLREATTEGMAWEYACKMQNKSIDSLEKDVDSARQNHENTLQRLCALHARVDRRSFGGTWLDKAQEIWHVLVR